MKKIFACLFLFSCSAEFDDTRDFRADVTFTAAEQLHIRNYLYYLSEKTGEHISVEFNYPHINDRGYPCSDRRVILRTSAHGGGHEGGRAGIIRVGTEWAEGPRDIAWITAHEMGHDLGFNHVMHQSSLMSPLVPMDTTFSWSEYDQAECVRVGVCK